MIMKILTTKNAMYRCDCITRRSYGTMELFRNRSFVVEILAKEVAQIIVHESMLPKKTIVDDEVVYV
jgi:uncharacterized protein YqgQ